MRTVRISNTNGAPTTTTEQATLSPPGIPQQHSPWHSPVPYLFGGLAAMLGLIAFALLILACSYWKLSGRLENGEGGEGDVESGGEKQGDSCEKAMNKVYEEKFLVIMAGNEKPTFLATPMSTKASSFADKDGKTENNEEKVENGEKVKEEDGDHQQMATAVEDGENQETQQQNQ